MPLIRKILFLLLFPLTCSAQSWQIDLYLGGSNYIGDLAPDLVLSETQPSIGVGIKRLFNPYLAASVNLTYGSISGDDANTDHLEPRNLSFQSSIVEFSPQLDFNFFKFGTGLDAKRFSPYIFTGISVFLFNPKAEYNDELHELQPLGTEGQGLPGGPEEYRKWDIAVPIGGGMKMNLSSHWNLTLQCGYRTTFTDYLDDLGGNYYNQALISELKGPVAGALSDRSGESTGIYLGRHGKQKGITDTKDWYMFAGFTISYIIQPPACYEF